MSSDKRHLHRYNPVQPKNHRPTTLSELAILQKHHQFIREDDDREVNPSNLSWEDKLALSWYSKLFREYAVCDLTHYKTGGVALRWRTESEVLDRVGELTCGNLHCKYHKPVDSPEDRLDEDDMRPLIPRELTPYQLNFQYQEQGKTKQALVKVVLCPKCKSKLTWKKDQERIARGEQEEQEDVSRHRRVDKGKGRSTEDDDEDYPRDRSEPSKRRRSSRSRSPQRSSTKEKASNGKTVPPTTEHDRASQNENRHRSSRKEEQPPAKPRIRTVITSLMGKYYEAILSGSKTWEGRTNTPRYATLREGDEFIFNHAEDASKPAFKVRILEVEKFDNFKDMLLGRVGLFLPSVGTLEEAVQVYENISGYREQVRECGAAAFRVKVIDRGESGGADHR